MVTVYVIWRKAHPSYTQVLATQVEQVHRCNGIVGCLRCIILYESITPDKQSHQMP